MGQKLPDDVRESLRIHDGQGKPDQGVIYRCWLCKTGEILSNWQFWSESIVPAQETNPEDYYLDQYSSTPQDAIQCLYATRGWIPLHDWDGNHIGIDLNPGPCGEFGQVINFGRDASEKYVLAPSWAHFLEDIADELEAGNFILEFNEEGEIETFCPANPVCAHDQFPNGFAAWSAAKLPDDFGGATFVSLPIEVPAPPREWALAAKWVQGFLNSMFEWESRWLARRPLEPLGIIQLVENQGRLKHVVFDPRKGPIHSGAPEVIFGSDSIEAAMKSFDQSADKLGEAFAKLSGESSCFANSIETFQASISQFADLPERLKSHPLAEVYRNPARSQEFFDEGRIYMSAIEEKRAIFAKFAPHMAMREDFVQTDPPRFSSRWNRIDDVVIGSDDRFIVYMKPTTDLSRVYFESQGSVTYTLEVNDDEPRQCRYHVALVDGSPTIQRCELRVGEGKFHKYRI